MNPFDWSGTAPRRSFWAIQLVVFALAVVFELFRRQSPQLVWIFLLSLAIAQLFYWAVVVRRLHDMGRSGFWGLLLLIPLIQFGAILWLGIAKGQTGQDGAWPKRMRHRVAQAVLLLLIPVAISRAFWAPYWIPSGSMKPTLLIGDFLLASNLAEDAPVHRGDVLIVTHPVNGLVYIMRLIGLPGDKVEMLDGQVRVNDVPVEYQQVEDFVEIKVPQGPMQNVPRCANDPIALSEVCHKDQMFEILPEGRQYLIVDMGEGPGDNTIEFAVPRGTLFLLGDNRDNSLDSRFDRRIGGPGMIPRENVVGRAGRILFSSSGQSLWAVWSWRWDRVFIAVR